MTWLARHYLSYRITPQWLAAVAVGLPFVLVEMAMERLENRR